MNALENNNEIKGGEVVLYKNRLEVRLNKETVWLSLNQLAELFGRDKSVISRHMSNIFKTGELDPNATVAKFATVQKEGAREILRQIEYYNLDTIISVGYRVNSKEGTQFRIWATQVLKKHLIEGYTLNEKRLRAVQGKYLELRKAIALIGNVAAVEGLAPEAAGIAQVIAEYSRALDILDDFDHEKLSKPKGTKKARFELTYEEARKIIDAMKKKFHDSTLVGREKDAGFRSSIGAVYQTFGGKDVYPTVEEKAAHLLYFVTKNHSFVDGNKRIAAALFVCFLQRNGILLHKDGTRRIDDNALVALTLMVAASKASEKDVMTKVILNLLG